MPVYSTHQAKTHLSELIRMAERGETITITRGLVPVALLVRIGATPQPRRPGTLAATMRLNPALDFRDGPHRPHRTPDLAADPDPNPNADPDPVPDPDPDPVPNQRSEPAP
jgi:antitoxin (DNA-binding transcriptional repressor) of toxin-antitoxin stability system